MDGLDFIKSVLPFLGTALGGPLGGAAASFLGDKLGLPAATIDSVKSVLSGMTPEKLAEFKQADEEFKLKMVALGYDSQNKLEEFNSANLIAVNKTMQVEAISEHWPSYSWRPFVGFIFGVTFFGTYFVLPLAHIPVPSIPSEAWLSIGGILGVASYFRGKAQADPNIQTTQITDKG